MSVVAIVGRPNVGKSTLFNRILGQRRAIVEDYPGVTRDRNYAEVTRFDRPFWLVDTGGFEPETDEPILAQMRLQSQFAIEEADLILFVLDGREGVTPADHDVAALLRQSDKPVIYVVNKVDGERDELHAAEAYTLGIDAFETVSAEHGRGIDALMRQVLAALPEAAAKGREDELVRLAVIGRPNVGKSSLVNRLLGFERVVVNPLAGTTRDSVDTPFTFNRRRYLLVDTAGIRRKGRVSAKTEKFSVIQALKSMEQADVVLVLVDAVEGVTDQDVTVAGYAHDKGRAVILVVNKWDLVAKDERTAGRYVESLRMAFKFLPQAPVVFVSALTGLRVSKIMGVVEEVIGEYRRQLPTARLNSVLQEAFEAHPPALVRGRRPRFFYATQVGHSPPTFLVFVSHPEDFHFSYERYLINRLREAFDLGKTPLRLVLRQRPR